MGIRVSWTIFGACHRLLLIPLVMIKMSFYFLSFIKVASKITRTLTFWNLAKHWFNFFATISILNFRYVTKCACLDNNQGKNKTIDKAMTILYQHSCRYAPPPPTPDLDFFTDEQVNAEPCRSCGRPTRTGRTSTDRWWGAQRTGPGRDKQDLC